MNKCIYKGYELQQLTTYNYHYVIIDLKTNERVFHCSCTKLLNENEMKNAIDLYLRLKKKY